jgi:hypothetical protein
MLKILLFCKIVNSNCTASYSEIITALLYSRQLSCSRVINVELGVLHYFKFSLALVIKAVVISETSVTFTRLYGLTFQKTPLIAFVFQLWLGSSCFFVPWLCKRLIGRPETAGTGANI